MCFYTAGWLQYGDQCYFFGLNGATWFDADAACMGMESHLAKIKNKWIDNWLWTKRPSAQSYYWIGLTDIENEGNFTWNIDNTVANYTQWASGYGKVAETYDVVAWGWKDGWFDYPPSTLQREYGVNFVRDVLGVDDYKISDNLREARADFQDFQRTIKSPIRELDNIEIPLQEISTQQEGQELLETAKDTKDLDIDIKRIKQRISDLEIEKDGILEIININKNKLNGQIDRIKQTIVQILDKNKTLGERIRTLFREQGITIVSVLTAFGMIIGVIVEAFTGSPSPSPSPPSKGGVQDWIKKQLKNLGKLLSFLAGKLAAALPGIIGSIVSWLLSATKDVVNWFANNLWALLILVVSLLFTAARDYLKK
ncbi:Hypothetical predicted protein [Mytilus galloprovincialis]|uniref:C-type lectin domain-containing protein n=1 Tax=Mytilus galloprovincialis TaxID=29158 RepID=A0A8B6D7Z8_MYTGA|nr:Hypothetical predicted protein [Mytilus galloprovincialis]